MVGITTFSSVAEARIVLAYQIWVVTGFLSHMFILDSDDSFDDLPLWKHIFYIALGPLNIIRIIKRIISKKK